ncbi:MAG: U32 family peptidase [Bacteroidales bacterium]|nr:U32 family peptidase [Bacteroidales bacterium]
MSKMNQEIEIMSPVGSYESLMAAIQAGAGSVYFGVGKLNMRSRSSVNFTLEDLSKITRICRKYNVKSYLTLNTVIYDEEISEVERTIDAAKVHGVSAIIASDLAVLEYAHQQGVEIHISTQCNITNISAVKFYSRYADVMVTARELSLDQVAGITRQISEQDIRGPKGELIRIEVFVHGALCMAVSGKCYLSLHNHHTSANRGACLQDCRRKYIVKDKETDLELEIDNEYIMSPKDLKTIHLLDKVLDAGITVLKIEGRGRSAEYVKTVTQCYREAVEAWKMGEFTAERIEKWDEQLSRVYNRGFWEGYYLGKELGEWSPVHGSLATEKKIYVGIIANYFGKSKIAHVRMDTQELELGDKIQIIGPTTGVYEAIVSELVNQDQVVEKVIKGDQPTFPVSRVVRRSDKVYKVVPANR